MTSQQSDGGHSGTTPACPACGGNGPALAARLAGLLRGDDVDAAIEAGLMAYAPCPGCAGLDACGTADALAADAVIAAAQQRLRRAWAARDRHAARTARLQRREAERAAKRAPPATPAPGKPALPPAAAAALERARARAAGKA